MANVGVYELHHQVGTGGMGSVWYATKEGAPTAIKFVERDPADVMREVHAMATLSHPNIATVFDYGFVGETDECRAAINTPWIAMEFTHFGTLKSSESMVRERWREIANQILDALAHAHARGITHRDLKPANILIASTDPLVIKIADFGLARRITAEEGGHAFKTCGTPKYMAPEQVSGRTRDQGPWTDLYGFGCVMFWLLTGAPPYTYRETSRVFEAHLHEPIPSLGAETELRSGVDGWLQRLLGKSYLNRYRFAADAKRDLHAVKSARLEPMPPILPSSGKTETDVFPPTISDATSRDLPFYSLRADELAFQFSSPEIGEWKSSNRHSPKLEELASVSLFGLREIPIVGREAERDELWAALSDSKINGVQWIDIRGTEGTGKTHLAMWLVERSHELGAAHTFVARNSAFATSEIALATMIASYFGCQELRRGDQIELLSIENMTARIAYVFSAYGIAEPEFSASEIATFVHRNLTGDIGQQNVREARGWHTPFVAFLRRLALERPVVLFIDDAQWGFESVAFIDRLLSEDDLALVVMTTSRTDDEDVLLTGFNPSRKISLAPLNPQDHFKLVTKLLGLHKTLAERVCARTDGNPLFAVQLIESWVRENQLKPTPSGFVLLTDTSFPKTLPALLGDRIIAARASSTDSIYQALEIAAAIGNEVPRWLWFPACESIGVRVSDRDATQLVELGFLRETPTGWSFVHGSVVQVLCDIQKREGHLRRSHREVALAFEARFSGQNEHAFAIASHWIAAGEPNRALPLLLVAAEVASRLSEFVRVREIYRIYEEATTEGSDIDVARGMIQRSRNLMFSDNLDTLGSTLDLAEKIVENADDPLLSGELYYARARLTRHRGQSPKTIPLALKALKFFESAEDAMMQAETRRTLGEAYRRTGQYEKSESMYLQSLAHYRKSGEQFLAGWCEFGLAALMKQKSDFERTIVHLDRARRSFESTHSRSSLAAVYNEMGEAARYEEKYDEARDFYSRALGYYAQTDGNLGVTQFNLAMCHLAQNDVRSAMVHLRQALVFVERVKRADVKTYVSLAIMLCMSKSQDWDQWRHHWREVQSVPMPTDTDVALLLEQNAIVCAEAGHPDAVVLAEYAGDVWEKVGRPEDAERVRKLILKGD